MWARVSGRDTWRARKNSRCTVVVVYIYSVRCTKYTCIYLCWAADMNHLFTCLKWLVPAWNFLFVDTCNMTCSHVWHDLFTCNTMHSHVWHDLSHTCKAFTFVTWLVTHIWCIHMCDMMHTHTCDAFTCVTWCIHTYLYLHAWHDIFQCDVMHSFTCVTWLFHTCDMMRWRMSHDLFRHNSSTFDMSHSKNKSHINFRPLHSTASIPQSMCVCACVRARACMHARACICVCVCLCVYVCTCICACSCVCVSLLVRVCVRVRVYEWVCVGEFVTQLGWCGRSPHLNRAATHCNTLQYTAIHCNTWNRPVSPRINEPPRICRHPKPQPLLKFCG